MQDDNSTNNNDDDAQPDCIDWVGHLAKSTKKEKTYKLCLKAHLLILTRLIQ